jgi:LPS-assembly protein
VIVKNFDSIALLTLSVLLAFSAPAGAQTAATEVAASPDDVDFAADNLEYDNDADIVTASGSVNMTREGNRVRADKIVWNRKTGEVLATGNVSVTAPGGDVAYGDSIALTDTLKDGVVENLLIVMTDGGRLAAKSGTRVSGITNLDRAVYSPCRVEDDKGCPKNPVWRITALRVKHDPIKNRVSYKNARLEVFGLPILALPGFSHPADNLGATGFLIPNFEYSRTNGVQFSIPFHYKIDRSRDITVTPHIFSNALPALDARYRALTKSGAYQIGGYATYGTKIDTGLPGATGTRDFRGYLDASGRFQIDPYWSIRGSLRLTTDRTFLRRYDISRDDRLRSTVEIERLTSNSYFSIAGWGFQTLRPNDLQGQIPIVLPLIDYRRRFENILSGGRLDLQLNSMSLTRASGQDTQRAFAGARWDIRRLTPMGQEVILTAYGRADVYHSTDAALTATTIYRGKNGWQTRAIGAVAAEVRWPFAGPLLGGFQRLTPRIQIVGSPSTTNLDIPNEDARAIELEDSNLFALNRFPGYDRWEDGTRITYGVDWALTLPGISIEANLGQSYRLTSRATLFPDGTGLTNRLSDFVGRTSIKYKRWLVFTHRYRLNKDNFAIRRNEIDATIGSDKTYATLGYLRLNRDVSLGIEDLRDREELRVGGRIQMARYWSLFGSAIVDLTGRGDDPTSLSNGYQPIRHRLGIAYEDDCLRLGLTWRRDYDESGDARRGSTFQLQLSFKNLGS